EMDWRPEMLKAPKRRVHFFYRLGVIRMIPVIGPLGYFFYPYGLLSLIVLPFTVALGVGQHGTVGYSSSDRQLTMEFRGIGTHPFFMRKKRIHAVEISRSYFQRRKSLASAQATIMSGLLGAAARVEHIERQDASRILAWYEPSNQKAEENEKSQPELSG